VPQGMREKACLPPDSVFGIPRVKVGGSHSVVQKPPAAGGTDSGAQGGNVRNLRFLTVFRDAVTVRAPGHLSTAMLIDGSEDSAERY
jgi:hypothetical protein